MKIACYTVALNEATEVADWLAATADADLRVVVDTGSTDDTQELLSIGGVITHQATIRPWRFDDAFNIALALIPHDIDVVFRIDMDERPRPGWRAAIEAAFVADPFATILRYPYHWSGSSCFYGDRVHVRHGYRWKGPTHEGLTWRGEGSPIEHWTDDIVVDHFQKPKERPNDIKLLHEAVTEYPNDVRLCLYHARELATKGSAGDAIFEIRRYQSFDEPIDLAYSYRLLALVEPDHQLAYLEESIRLAENASTHLALAWYWYEREDWINCVEAITACLAQITEVGDWTDDLRLRTAFPYDIGSVAAWQLGDVTTAKTWVLEAFKRDPRDQRIAANLVRICGLN